MRNLIIIAFLLIGSANMAFSQCPPSNTRGIHVVQSKDNLYRISLAYGVSMGEICKWNNIKLDDVLPVCTPLRVRQPMTAPTPPTVTNVIPQAEDIPDEFNPKSDPNAGNPTIGSAHNYANQGKKHTVKYGETVAGLAELYGFTERKFRQLNALSPSQNVTPGSILLTTECSCAVLNTDFHTAQPHGTKPATTTHSSPGANKPNIPTGHTSTSHPQATSPVKNLSPRDHISPKGNQAAIRAPYMKQVEYSMTEEINLLRSNPAGYAKFVEQYRKSKKKAGYTVPDATVDELIRELKNTTPLRLLETSECVYNAAKSHGLDVKRTGKAGHKGSDGSMPWDRVKRYCPDFQDGNENLVGGPALVRESVIILLIDHGISSRGHRKTLLNPHWTHVACYKMGQVGQMPNTWIQKFGQARASTSHGQSSHMYNSNPTIHSNSSRPVIHSPNQFSTKGATTSYSSPSASFMKYEENKMTQEINLMRSNPANYIKYIEEYRASKKRAGYSLPDATIDELISEMRNMQALSQLQPSSCVYNAATKHGQDIRRMGKTAHKGSDGSWPWDRVKRSCTNFRDGNENLVGGTASVREAVIILLIDHGVSTRSHRRSLLNPYWTHVACYKIGQVGQLPNCWVQKFGQL